MREDKFNIYLRALEPSDYLISYKWRNDLFIQEGVTGNKYFVSSEQEKRWVDDAIADRENIRLAICLKEDDRYIGNTYMINIDWINRKCQIPIFLGDASVRGKGISVQARLLMLSFAFYERNMHKVWAHVLAHNSASIRMNEKAGFKKDGLLRDEIFKDGMYHDVVVMSVLKEEFDPIALQYGLK
jgi:ribosomal-protein-alanine N-acetyltransferase